MSTAHANRRAPACPAGGRRPGQPRDRPSTFFGLAYAAFSGRDNIAYSPIALGLFGWAIIWGFLTALSRYTAEDFAGIAIWDVVERGPNYLAPAALVYLIYRQMHATETAEKAKPTKAVPGAPVPTH